MPRLIVALGSGDVVDLPAVAVQAVRESADVVHALDIADDVVALLGVETRTFDAASCPDDAVVVAPDVAAFAISRVYPDTPTVPDRERLRARAIGAGVARLAQVGAELRLLCPWDREQVPETIVPHTIEEAFEVAEAFHGDDPERQIDEIGDLLFQSVFLARFLEEDGVADLGSVAEAQADKLISRHPHVYGDEAAADAGAVRGLWERQKRASRGGEIFHEVPAGLSALAFSSKIQKRAAAVGFVFPGREEALGKLSEELDELRAAPDGEEVGDVLFAAIAVARALGVDPELAVRLSATKFRDRVDRAAALASDDGRVFEELDLDTQFAYYLRAKAELTG